MLTTEQIDVIRDRLEEVSAPLNEYLISDIARRIIEAGQITSTSRYQAQITRMLGVSDKEVKQYLEKYIDAYSGDLGAIFDTIAGLIWEQNQNNTGIKLPPIEKNEALQGIIQTCIDLATDDFENLTQTLGFIDPWGNPLPLREAYVSACDYAFNKVWSGATDYNTAIRESIRNITRYGVRIVNYESGVHTSLDSAVRRSVFGGMGLMVEKIEQTAHDDIGADGWEISAHEACAKDHEQIQGRQYTDAEYEALNNSLVRRIGTLNCKHTAFPIIIGVNEPQYTEEQLRQMQEYNEKGVEYEGRHYTMYEATQMQRRLERAIRQTKNNISAYSQSDTTTKELSDARSRYQTLIHKYKDFSNIAGLRTRDERLESIDFGIGHIKFI